MNVGEGNRIKSEETWPKIQDINVGRAKRLFRISEMYIG
jgi:hypothetical protein